MTKLAENTGSEDRRAISNTIWIASERLASSMLGILSILAVARLLGVVPYGHYAFSLSVLGVGLAFGHLGLDGLLIKKILEKPQSSRSILGTVSLAKFAIYLPLFLATFNAHLILDIGPTGAQVLRSLSVVFLILPISSAMIAWLHAQTAFRQSSVARIAAVVLGTTAKVALILAGFEVVAVGWAHSLIFALEMALLLLLAARMGAPMPLAWTVDIPIMRELLGEGFPLFLASLFAMIYVNTDVIALRFMTDTEVVGEYALVQQVLQASQIIPFAVALASFPALVAASREDLSSFFARSTRILLAMVIGGFAVCAGVFYLAPWVVPLLFGERYQPTAELLQVASLAFPFIFIRQLTTKMFICLQLGWRLAFVEGLALALAISLNVMLIPLMSSRGSAIAVVGTYAFTSMASLAVLWIGKRVTERELR